MNNVEALYKKIVGRDPRHCEPKMSHCHMVRRIQSELRGRTQELFAAFDQENTHTVTVAEFGVSGNEPYTLLRRSDGKCAFLFGVSTDGRDENLDAMATSAHWFDPIPTERS